MTVPSDRKEAEALSSATIRSNVDFLLRGFVTWADVRPTIVAFTEQYDELAAALAEAQQANQRLQQTVAFLDTKVAVVERYENALREIAGTLGPEPGCDDGCRGCTAEMAEALRVARAALAGTESAGESVSREARDVEQQDADAAAAPVPTPPAELLRQVNAALANVTDRYTVHWEAGCVFVRAALAGTEEPTQARDETEVGGTNEDISYLVAGTEESQ